MSDADAALGLGDPVESGSALATEFAAWLAALPDDDAVAPPEERVDLFTLVGQFAALRHEVNMQTKAARAAVDALTTPRHIDNPDRAAKPLVKALIDIADALRMGLSEVESARERLIIPAPRPGWFARLFAAPPVEDKRPATLAAVADGYALSVRRAERALESAGVDAVDALGHEFDPETMEAVGLADGPEGEVVSESRKGYRWRGSLLRPAQVTVGRGS